MEIFVPKESLKFLMMKSKCSTYQLFIIIAIILETCTGNYSPSTLPNLIENESHITVKELLKVFHEEEVS